MVPPQRCLLAHFETTLHFLAVASLLSHNNMTISYYVQVNKLSHNNITISNYVQVNSLYTAKIECSFKMGKQTPLGVQFILLLMVHVLHS